VAAQRGQKTEDITWPLDEDRRQRTSRGRSTRTNDRGHHCRGQKTEDITVEDKRQRTSMRTEDIRWPLDEDKR
jgi:hypothetical protein